MKQQFWIIALLFLFLQYDFCFAQQQFITSYQNKEHPNLDISLNGKVKSVIQISWTPSEFCDTISPYINTLIDTTRIHIIQSGRITMIQCSIDTIIYSFDDNLFPENIENIECYIDMSKRKSCKKNIYNFTKKNLISETYIQDGIISDKITYGYDINNNIISKKKHYYGLSIEDTLEYDSHNNLIRRTTYRQEIGETPIIFTTETYQYDSLGYLIAKTKDNIRKTIYVNDAHGNKTEEGRCMNYKGRKCKYKPYKGFAYDENNRLIKEFAIGKHSPHNTDTYYQYDEKGNKIEAKGYYITKDTVLGYHYTYEYNENGQQIKEELRKGKEIYFPGVRECKKLITSYDDNKNIIQQRCYSAENQTIKIIRYYYEYDSFGNWIKRETWEGKDEEDLSKKLIVERIIEYY